jgi:ribosomal protein L29
MKKKDKQRLREMNMNELETLLKKRRDELFELKLDKAQNKLKNTRLLFLTRQEIACMLTIIVERQFSQR